MKDIINKINMILEIEEEDIESLDEELRVYDNTLKQIDTRKVMFTKKNIQKIAYEYDAKIETMDKDLKSAKLRDSRNRLLFIDGA